MGMVGCMWDMGMGLGVPRGMVGCWGMMGCWGMVWGRGRFCIMMLFDKFKRSSTDFFGNWFNTINCILEMYTSP